VWIRVDTTDATSIVAYVKQAEYKEEEGREGWVYKVQEQDKEGIWCGSERWKRENALKRA
jgi:hypothetical protein